MPLNPVRRLLSLLLPEYEMTGKADYSDTFGYSPGGGVIISGRPCTNMLIDLPPHADLPLRRRGGDAADRALLLRRLAQVRPPGLPPALDQVLGHPQMRALQVHIHHGVKGKEGTIHK